MRSKLVNEDRVDRSLLVSFLELISGLFISFTGWLSFFKGYTKPKNTVVHAGNTHSCTHWFLPLLAVHLECVISMVKHLKEWFLIFWDAAFSSSGFEWLMVM